MAKNIIKGENLARVEEGLDFCFLHVLLHVSEKDKLPSRKGSQEHNQ
jgi:hypothetical protein